MKKTHIFILFLIAIGLVLLGSQMKGFSRFVSFEDARQQEDRLLKVSGYLVMDKEVVYDPIVDPNTFSFYMKDKAGEECKVICYKEKPMDFERCEEIVLTGKMRDEVFHANHILVKCPSKYIEEGIEKPGSDYYEGGSPGGGYPDAIHEPEIGSTPEELNS